MKNWIFEDFCKPCFCQGSRSGFVLNDVALKSPAHSMTSVLVIGFTVKNTPIVFAFFRPGFAALTTTEAQCGK